MKAIKRFAFWSIGILVVLALILNYGIGAMVKSAVVGIGSPLMGVPITLEDAHFRLLQGVIRLNGFVLGNPEGFKTDHAIRVEEVAIDFDVKSLFADPFVIRSISVKGPEIVYELGLGKSNIGRILEKLEGSGEAEPEPEKKEQPARKVIIDDFRIEGARVRLSSTVAMGLAAPVPLPDIHLTGIGREEGGQGASVTETLKRVFGAVATAVGQVATGAVDKIGEGAKALGTGAGKVVGGVKSLIGIGKADAATNETDGASKP